MVTYYVTMALATGLAGLAGLRAQREGVRERLSGAYSPAGKSLAFLSGAVLTFVAAFRWRVGVDYSQYASNYSAYTRLGWSDLELHREPGIRALAKMSAWVRDDYTTMLALASVITVGLMVRTLYKHSDAFAFSILLFILTMTWQGSFNGVRQYIACAILFAGHKYILERRFVRYAFVVALASLFHVSALVALLLYWLPRSRLGYARAILLIALAVLAVSMYDVLGGVVDWIKQDEVSAGTYFDEQVNPLRIGMGFAPVLVYLAVTDKSLLRAKDHFYVNMLFVNAAVMLASSGSAYIARFSVYTSVYVALALPRIMKTRDLALPGLLVPVTLLAYFTFWYLETSNEPSLRNFRWVFFQ